MSYSSRKGPITQKLKFSSMYLRGHFYVAVLYLFLLIMILNGASILDLQKVDAQSAEVLARRRRENLDKRREARDREIARKARDAKQVGIHGEGNGNADKVLSPAQIRRELLKEKRFSNQIDLHQQKEFERRAHRMTNIKREALSLKIYDDSVGWVNAEDDTTRDQALKEYIKESYDRIPLVLHSETGSPVITNRNLEKYFNSIMDIDSQGLEDDEILYIQKQVQKFKEREGKLDNDGFSVIGYLNTGSPLQFTKDLWSDLNEIRMSRELRRQPKLLLLGN